MYLYLSGYSGFTVSGFRVIEMQNRANMFFHGVLDNDGKCKQMTELNIDYISPKYHFIPWNTKSKGIVYGLMKSSNDNYYIIQDIIQDINISLHDYLAYSRDTVLRDCRIRYNDPSFFDMDLKVVSFDSEGRPLRLAQFCSGKDVYLFDLPTYYHEVRRVLEDPDVKKILCDARSEEASFGIAIHNYTDIQAGSPERKSLAKLVEAHTGVTVKKNRLIHMHGWKHERRWTKDQLDYAAADVLWTLAVYANHQNAA